MFVYGGTVLLTEIANHYGIRDSILFVTSIASFNKRIGMNELIYRLDVLHQTIRIKKHLPEATDRDIEEELKKIDFIKHGFDENIWVCRSEFDEKIVIIGYEIQDLSQYHNVKEKYDQVKESIDEYFSESSLASIHYIGR